LPIGMRIAMGLWIALRPERSIRKTLRGLVARQMERQRVANGVRTKALVRGGGLMALEDVVASNRVQIRNSWDHRNCYPKMVSYSDA
jgi:IS5 family transposase